MSDHDPHHHNVTVIETIQSLVVAFVLAMTFRGFAVEGFVIPTGSMAPTLLGQHLRLRSSPTGYEYPAGVDSNPNQSLRPGAEIFDPMLGPELDSNIDQLNAQRQTGRMGDRILVLKCLYPFLAPKRFDVVVFKNPTDPNGDSGNYIKRLIGLPNESVLLVDGDVFVTDYDKANEFESYQIQRKPEYIQRAVWQPINNSDYVPDSPSLFAPDWNGSFWFGNDWNTDGRQYTCDTAQPTTLNWNAHLRPITDWTPYNMFMPTRDEQSPTSDIRVTGAVVPQDSGLVTTLELRARSCVFEFHIEKNKATLRVRTADADASDPKSWTGVTEDIKPLPAGKATNLEFWHVDQAMYLFINGKRVAYYEYDWHAIDRMRHAFGRFDNLDINTLAAMPPVPAELSWHFSGSPLTLERVRLERDLYYHQQQRMADIRPFVWGFATHPDHPGKLGPDHFMMAGDNSTSSLDSRFWKGPHELVRAQIDPTWFVVNRKLLIGKAWMVYFPSPYPVTEGGNTRIIPDFGRLRFIR